MRATAKFLSWFWIIHVGDFWHAKAQGRKGFVDSFRVDGFKNAKEGKTQRASIQENSEQERGGPTAKRQMTGQCRRVSTTYLAGM
ncbi:hypothetical protein HYN43_023580 [Mucilaginibacter celer]|uniref:Uncharacterized protein n=1 Tax=Mucilaginibacter celer TaxID=2305508 RepID=A0A494W2V7_9SPHI|nr:hypothetical protein HYN43_023580 [Mucilaginibacter celer]